MKSNNLFFFQWWERICYLGECLWGEKIKDDSEKTREFFFFFFLKYDDAFVVRGATIPLLLRIRR